MTLVLVPFSSYYFSFFSKQYQHPCQRELKKLVTLQVSNNKFVFIGIRLNMTGEQLEQVQENSNDDP